MPWGTVKRFFKKKEEESHPKQGGRERKWWWRAPKRQWLNPWTTFNRFLSSTYSVNAPEFKLSANGSASLLNPHKDYELIRYIPHRNWESWLCSKQVQISGPGTLAPKKALRDLKQTLSPWIQLLLYYFLLKCSTANFCRKIPKALTTMMIIMATIIIVNIYRGISLIFLMPTRHFYIRFLIKGRLWLWLWLSLCLFIDEPDAHRDLITYSGWYMVEQNLSESRALDHYFFSLSYAAI